MSSPANLPKVAARHYKKAIQLHLKGRNQDALASFRAAIKANPRHINAWNSMGSLLMLLDRPDEGAECFKGALAIDPEDATSLLNFGSYLTLVGKFAEAEIKLKHAIKADPRSAPAYQKLGLFYYMLKSFEPAEQLLRRSLEIRPNDTQAQIALAEILVKKGEVEKALTIYEQICVSEPNNLIGTWGRLLTLQPIYANNTEVDEKRTSFRRGISYLNDNVGNFLGLSSGGKLEALQRSNFLLAYQGRDDLDLQQDYAHFQRSILESALPQYYRNIERKPLKGRRLKVAYVSEFFYYSTVGKYFSSWITELDPEKFEKVVFSLAKKPDQLSSEIQQSSDAYHQQDISLTALAKAIYEAELDVIIYPDLGMNSRTFAIASLRLAPLQCAAWGHPVTTGHDNIDVFLSVASMEPSGAEAHYSEKLVRLPGIGTSYPSPPVPTPAGRSSLGLPGDAILYLFPQSLFKIHPDNDALLVEILKLEPRAVLVMFGSPEQAVNKRFSARLGKEFDRQRISASGRLKVLSRMNHQTYLRVNLACDVMLDSLYWSGGNTALDAIACALPLVTLPGEFMRGRQSFAMLSAMGLDELIADSEENFVQTALELGRDPHMRERIRNVMSVQSSNLFNQKEPIRFLESFLLSSFPD